MFGYNNVCVVYHYHETEDYKKNLIHFLLFGYLRHVDYYIIINDECTIDLPILPNVKYIYHNSKQYDYGGYSLALKKFIPECLKKNIFDVYEYFIFINSTVRGPFTPYYCVSDWVSILTNTLNSNVGISGSTINILHEKQTTSKELRRYKQLFPDSEYNKIKLDLVLYDENTLRDCIPHVQSMCFVLQSDKLKYLMSQGLCENTEATDKIEQTGSMKQTINFNKSNQNKILEEEGYDGD